MTTDHRHHPDPPPAGAAAMFRAFFEQGTQYAALLAPDGTVIEVNRQALAPWQLRREDVVGRPLWEGYWWRGAPAMVDRVRAGVAQAAAGQVFCCDLPYFGADGGPGFADVVIAPLLGDDGRVVCLSATGADATERRRVEERLRLLDEIGEATRIAADPKAIN